jgi:uncharacterized protein
VNKNTHPLRLNVGYMIQKPISTSREIPIAIETLEIEDLLIKNLRSVVQTSKTREGLLLQVQADAEVQTDCVRCLEEFHMQVSVTFEELFQFPSRHREETDLLLPDDGFIDLAPLFREYFILAMPIKQICTPDCMGLCVVCGANLNQTTCQHHSQPDSSSIIINGEEKA